MVNSPRIPSVASRVCTALTPRPPLPCLLPLQSVWQPVVFPTPGYMRSRLYGSSPTPGTQSSTKDHAVDRAKRGDTTDPTSDAAAAGMKEREEREGQADRSKSQATTQRQGSQEAEKAKKEHPNAPTPIIGMNDERGEKGQ
ncbi:hypothetical protein P168DRAFT_323965 [Aspergillus campestris IBT 28561]|uniref:Uncharacterized protein n=1 Tax=Aspergillus campestris (strain IBT 28561) TaxID=1392248 RepID=A0A2I1DGC2_ASPC2|nr:uncharacterized protein P168DRAFT_323965 [Aspergillus campestris IBT 28561]PKY08919.1 hypothetical protein P168DRAFT_323965 [Aspergillus campestris IBT 28561]